MWKGEAWGEGGGGRHEAGHGAGRPRPLARSAPRAQKTVRGGKAGGRGWGVQPIGAGAWPEGVCQTEQRPPPTPPAGGAGASHGAGGDGLGLTRKE